MNKRRKAVLAWGGFWDDKLDEWSSVGYKTAGISDAHMLAIFRRKGEAKTMYSDVRRIRITEEKP